MDGRLQLIRVVRRNSVGFEMLNTEGDATELFVDCLTPEDTERSLVGILCNDLMVLCKTPSPGQPPTNQVDLWAVLRMQTLATPASVVHGSSELLPRRLGSGVINTLVKLYASSITRQSFTLKHLRRLML
jgi:hypothetical protein